MNTNQTTYAYVGGWGYNENEPEHGFAVYRYQPETGTLHYLESALPDIRVGGVCFHPTLDILYCTDERTASHPEGGGQILALGLDRETGAIAELNRQPSFSCSPAYCAVDSTGKYLLAVNHGGNGMVTKTVLGEAHTYHLCREYDEANVVLYPLHPDGSIAEPADIVKLTGSGPRKSQKSSHPHCIMASPDGKLFAVCDFGADHIYTFAIDYKAQRLTKLHTHTSPAGSAPRYCAFHPGGGYFFANNEVRPYVEAFRYAQDGSFAKCSEVYVLPYPIGPDELPLISDIRIHPSGKYLYNLSRASNTVTVIGFNQGSGTMEVLQFLTLRGDFPKGCSVSPDGKYLYVAMKKSGEVLKCLIGADGLLTLTEEQYPMPNAANISFHAIEA